MESIQAHTAQGESPVPSLSKLLADNTVDRVGKPVFMEYRELWATKASANREKLGRLSEDEVTTIHMIARAAVDWEFQFGTIFTDRTGPIDDGHPGLQDAKIVPVKIKLGKGDGPRIISYAGDEALRNNDFRALRRDGLPEGARPPDLIRWRVFDSRFRPKISYPSHYLVWENHHTGDLFAQIPKPLTGMSRGDCDHCRIHDPDHAKEPVTHFDTRRHVDGIRDMSAEDTAVTPISLCRFHWWYVWSGELLRPSQVHALEVLVSEEKLFNRWGISHMDEFLLSMRCQISTADELLEDDSEGRRTPGPGPARGAWVNTLGETGLAELENSISSDGQGETASKTGTQTVSDGQTASATTADGPDHTRVRDQSTTETATSGLTDAQEKSLRFYNKKKEIEEASINTGKHRDPRVTARQAILQAPSRASRRRKQPLPKADSEFDILPSLVAALELLLRANGDSQPTNGSDSAPNTTNSLPAPESPENGPVGPPEPPRANGKSTLKPSYASVTADNVSEQSASQVNGIVAPRTAASVPSSQTNGAPTLGEYGLLYSPRTEPRSE